MDRFVDRVGVVDKIADGDEAIRVIRQRGVLEPLVLERVDPIGNPIGQGGGGESAKSRGDVTFSSEPSQEA